MCTKPPIIPLSHDVLACFLAESPSECTPRVFIGVLAESVFGAAHALGSLDAALTASDRTTITYKETLRVLVYL